MKMGEYLNINVDNIKFNSKVSFDIDSVLEVIDNIMFDLSIFNQYNPVFSKDIANMTEIRQKILDTRSKNPDLFY